MSYILQTGYTCRSMGTNGKLLLQNHLILIKLRMDEVLKVPYKCFCFAAGLAPGVVKRGHRRAPSSKDFFFIKEGCATIRM